MKKAKLDNTNRPTTSDAIETDVEVIFVGSLKSILPQIISRFMAREDARLRIQKTVTSSTD